ncbi:MAG TPA: class II aldolase/adducin family protein [Gemmatimonadaceae bacterium]|jgi:L-fuculose-phosphate aldolase|nr:class II aldolase/adducin family protein [Gemmatimonadaceae bacterium]
MRDAREAIVLVCRRLYERGLVAGPDGNVSVRRDDGTLIVTPTGLAKVDVTPDDLVVVSLEGLIREGRRAPSSELGMHLRIYQRRPDIRAVVHAHPPAATGFAVAGESFMAPVLPEVILQLGEVPLVPYATPGSDALADAFEPFLAKHDGFLMANHGATTIAPSLEAAHQRMESLEHAARILLAARGLGRVNELSAADVRSLRATREESR